MATHSLFGIYKRLRTEPLHLFVVPLIRYDYPSTDYLTNLYLPIRQDHPEINIHSTSALKHYEFVLAQLFGKQPILHYHWLEFQDWKSLVGMPYKLFCIALFTLFGGKLVWTVHNLVPHTKRWIKANRLINKWMARRANTILAHTPTACALAAEYLNLPIDQIEVYPHPPFPTLSIHRHVAIQQLEETFEVNISPKATLFMMASAISGYKQIPATIRALQQCTGNWQFFISGYIKKGETALDQELRLLASEDKRIIYKPGFISEELYPVLMNAADVCVFNFDAILYSGAVEMARSYQKAIIAPNLGGLADLEHEPQVSLFNTSKELITTLQSHINSTAND